MGGEKIRKRYKSKLTILQKIIATGIVIGGVTDLTSLEEASKWLRDFLWIAYAPMPVETYIKRKDGVVA